MTPANAGRYAGPHLRILGACWVAYGLISLAAAFVMLIYSGIATVMFGTLLSRVAYPFAFMNLFHIIYTLVMIQSIVCGLLGILAGPSLLAARRFGRGLAIAAAFLSLSRIPLGITLGVYTLAILLPPCVSPGAPLTAQ